MMQLANFLRRISPIVLFPVVGLVQMMLIALMVIDRMSILREGAEVMLQTRPVARFLAWRLCAARLRHVLDGCRRAQGSDLGGEEFVGLCQARTKDRWFL